MSTGNRQLRSARRGSRMLEILLQLPGDRGAHSGVREQVREDGGRCAGDGCVRRDGAVALRGIRRCILGNAKEGVYAKEKRWRSLRDSAQHGGVASSEIGRASCRERV